MEDLRLSDSDDSSSLSDGPINWDVGSANDLLPDDTDYPDLDHIAISTEASKGLASVQSNPNYFISWAVEGKKRIPNCADDFSRARDNVTRLCTRPFEVRLTKIGFDNYVGEGLRFVNDVVEFFVYGYLYILQNEFKTAKKMTTLGIRFADMCLRKGFIDVESFAGVMYLYRWTLRHYKYAQGKVSKRFWLNGAIVDDRREDFVNFESLEPKGKVFVLESKVMLLVAFKDVDWVYLQEANRILHEIIDVYPGNALWYVQIGYCFWKSRRENPDPLIQYGYACPSEAELLAYWKGYVMVQKSLREREASSTSLHQVLLADMRFCLILVCQSLAEIFRFGDGKPQQVKVCDKVLNILKTEVKLSLSDIPKFVTDKIRSLDTNGCPAGMILRAGEIMFNILPRQHRDCDLAEKLILESWNMDKSSKAAHKLGSLALMREEPERDVKALSYFRLGLEIKSNNFPCASDKIRAMMRWPSEFKEESLKDLEMCRSHREVRTGDFIEFNFLEGCVHLLTGDFELAVAFWLKVIVEDPSYNFRKNIRSFANRFQWPINSKGIDALVNNLYKRAVEKANFLTVQQLNRLREFLADTKRLPRNPINQERRACDEDRDWRRPNNNDRPTDALMSQNFSNNVYEVGFRRVEHRDRFQGFGNSRSPDYTRTEHRDRFQGFVNSRSPDYTRTEHRDGFQGLGNSGSPDYTRTEHRDRFPGFENSHRPNYNARATSPLIWR